MLCKESGNIRQREDYLSSLLCLFALQTKVETSSREKTTYLHFSVSMLCKECGNIRAERRLPTFNFSVSMICKESGNIRQREDYLPSLICLYALQSKWKHQAERRLPSFTSLSLCSAKKVETSAERRLPSSTSLSLCSANKVEASSREKTTYLHFSVSMLCKECGNIRQREDYLASLLCPYALRRKWKHQAERRLPIFTSLSLCSAN